MAYTLEGRKCGTVRFENRTVGTVQKETTTMSAKVTSVPMEDGSDINDHVTIDPQKFSINGVIIDAAPGEGYPWKPCGKAGTSSSTPAAAGSRT